MHYHIKYYQVTSLKLLYCSNCRVFASKNANRRVTLSRRDDLESLGYVLIHSMGYTLPWNKNRRRLSPSMSRER